MLIFGFKTNVAPVLRFRTLRARVLATGSAGGGGEGGDRSRGGASSSSCLVVLILLVLQNIVLLRNALTEAGSHSIIGRLLGSLARSALVNWARYVTPAPGHEELLQEMWRECAQTMHECKPTARKTYCQL